MEATAQRVHLYEFADEHHQSAPANTTGAARSAQDHGGLSARAPCRRPMVAAGRQHCLPKRKKQKLLGYQLLDNYISEQELWAAPRA